MKLLFPIMFFSIIFTGCASNYNEISKSVKTAFLSEKTLKVGVKKAYVTEKTDAKSKIVSSVELNEDLIVIGLIENDEWFKVLTPNKEGYIPRNAVIEITIADSVGKMLSMAWKAVKNKDDKSKTTFTGGSKKWSGEERVRKLSKGFTQEDYLTGKKPKYDEKRIDSYFTDLSSSSSEKGLNIFRKEGGLN